MSWKQISLIILLPFLILLSIQEPVLQQQNQPLDPFGMNVHLGWRYDGKSFLQERAANMVDDAGISWIREEFTWAEIEINPLITPREYRWLDSERFNHITAMQSASYRNFNVLGLLTYGPGTNVNTGEKYDLGTCPPVIPDNVAPIEDWLPAWQAFVQEVANRFGDQIDYWEIQNEQDSSCFWNKVDKGAKYPNPADYVKVLKAAHEVIKEIDPSDQIVLGGMCPTDPNYCQDYYDYLKRVVDSGGWDYFDIIAIHPYRSPSPPEEVRDRSAYNVETLAFNNIFYQYNLIDEIQAFKTLMNHWGQKPIWLTEIGWSTYQLEERARQRSEDIGHEVSPEIVQSDYLIRTYVQAIAAGAEKIFWYDFRDDDRRNEDGTPNLDENSMGIVERDIDEELQVFPPKPAYYAFAAMSNLLTGSTYLGHYQGYENGWSTEDNIHEYRFRKGDQIIIVLWKSQGGDRPLDVTVQDVNGASPKQYGPVFSSIELTPSKVYTVVDKRITVSITERPIFIVYEEEEIIGITTEPRITSTPEPEPGDGTGFLDRIREWWAEQVAKIEEWWQSQLEAIQHNIEAWIEDQIRQITESVIQAIEQYFMELCGCAPMPAMIIGSGFWFYRKRRKT